MSSETDEEDELLQMALKEQSQREVNYQRPTSNPRKPVVNFVQPPKPPNPPPSMPSPNSYMGQRLPQQLRQENGANGKTLEDDDDSDIEMLSISSGDEELSKEFGKKGKAAGRIGGSRADDDRVWNGEEPGNWKMVDEAELTRRVRDMRETRTAPVAQKFEKKASGVNRKALNNLQSFPRGMECVDPLGLGVIDNKTLKLITDSSDSGPVISDRDYLDSNLREKLLYFSEKFDAKLFLSRIHQDTTAADLESGAVALKTDLKGRTQQRKQLVKDNFDCFVSCKTTIDDIETKLKRIEDDPESSGTTNLFNLMQGVSTLANRALEPLFERQMQAEKIRSVQGMLQRFRTLFNLPSAIRSSISKGEYDLAVREYKKAKSVALPSHVSILKRVLEEVEMVMQEFKGMLYKSLEDPNVDLANLENTVRLLLELEPDSDPVWHYLIVQNHRICGLLEKCTLDHEARMETLRIETQEKALADARWKKLQENPNQFLDEKVTIGDIHVTAESFPVDINGEEADKLRGKYIKRLTAIISYYIPAFWKIAVSVFSGKFAKVSSDSNATILNNKFEEKFIDDKFSSHSLDDVSAMICNTVSAYEVKVLNTFRDLEESNILRSFMSDAIKEIRKATQAIEIKEAAPSCTVAAIRNLQADVMKVYILRLCSWMRATTEEISKEEKWVPVSILERGKSPYLISILPLTFRSVISSAMDQISLMIKCLLNEGKKLEDVFVQIHEIEESVRLAFLNCFLDFAGHLEHIASELSQHKTIKSKYLQQNSWRKMDDVFPLPSGSVLDWHQQLLMVLSNIGFCKDELSYELYNRYKSMWLQSRTKYEEGDLQDLVMSFTALEEKVLAQYTLAKADVIRTAAVNYLLNKDVQWEAAPTVRGVRDAAVELLHTLVAVHSEVFSGAKPLLDKTLSILVEGLVDTLLSFVNESKNKEFKALDANGFCQLMLELDYFETILNQYFTPDARESLKSLQLVLLEKATENAPDADNPGHQRRATRGPEDALSEDRQLGAALPDDLIALAQQCSSELLQAELERTRVNTACFVESIPLDLVPDSAKAAYALGGPMDFRNRSYKGGKTMESLSFSRQTRR